MLFGVIYRNNKYIHKKGRNLYKNCKFGQRQQRQAAYNGIQIQIEVSESKTFIKIKSIVLLLRYNELVTTLLKVSHLVREEEKGQGSSILRISDIVYTYMYVQ